MRLPVLSTDGWLLVATFGVRSFAFGFLSVVLGLYLAALGLEPAAIGAVFTAALAGGATITVALTIVADRLGRRRVLVAGAGLMALAAAVFALTDNLALLILAAVIGTISPSGKEVGPFLSIEQAILPRTTSSEQRTAVFAGYNLVGSLTGALGALAVGLPAAFALEALVGYRLLVESYAAAALLLMFLFAKLSPAVEAGPPLSAERQAPARAASGPAPTPNTQHPRPAGARFGIHRSRGLVAKLAALFALDSFAGGFILQSLVAYWFHLRFSADATELALIFFGTNILSAVSFLAAAPLAARIGLLNTMVFTHLPSNFMLLVVPLMPSLELAATVFMARHLLAQLDVPTRQSYTMAVVDDDERSAAAGLTSVARSGGAALAPAFAGITLATPALGLPFLVAGALKIIYDLTILAVFRNVRPPEETRQDEA